MAWGNNRFDDENGVSLLINRGAKMIRDIKKIISEMTLEEKASLCSGLDS
jgi:hypothetical protein